MRIAEPLFSRRAVLTRLFAMACAPELLLNSRQVSAGDLKSQPSLSTNEKLIPATADRAGKFALEGYAKDVGWMAQQIQAPGRGVRCWVEAGTDIRWLEAKSVAQDNEGRKISVAKLCYFMPSWSHKTTINTFDAKTKEFLQREEVEYIVSPNDHRMDYGHTFTFPNEMKAQLWFKVDQLTGKSDVQNLHPGSPMDVRTLALAVINKNYIDRAQLYNCAVREMQRKASPYGGFPSYHADFSETGERWGLTRLRGAKGVTGVTDILYPNGNRNRFTVSSVNGAINAHSEERYARRAPDEVGYHGVFYQTCGNVYDMVTEIEGQHSTKAVTRIQNGKSTTVGDFPIR